MYHPDADQFQR